MEIEVELTRIIINEASDQQVVVLKELNGQRNFPIVIGMPEILAIDRRGKGFELPRPMTHDLLGSVIENMGGTLEKVVINDLNNHTFYAQLCIKTAGGAVVVDSRPSDALALSSGLEVPVFVDEQVFEKMQQ
jgi:uncharacterized protein